jgi:hypothetical protein
MYMTSSELLAVVNQITAENLQELKNKLSKLSHEQESWRPNDATWNLLEIYAHLNAFAAFYHTAFKHRIATTKFRTFKENFLSSPLGKSAWKSMKLGNAQNVKRRFKTQRNYNPFVNKELLTGNERSELITNLEELILICEQAKTINIRKAKVPISISKIVRLRVGDALLFVAYHNQRHIQQALNLLSHRAFPKK